MLNAITWLWRWLTSSDGTTTSAAGGTDMMDDGTDPAPPWPPR